MAERKEFHNIIPDQEERIGQRRPGSSGKSSRKASAEHARAGKNSGATGGFWKALIVVLVLSLGAVGRLGWQQYQQLTALQSSFDEFKARLASTSESLSQSGEAGVVLQLKLKEQGEELSKHWAEIKKLWGISYDINKKSIAENQKASAANKARLGKVEQATASLAKVGKQIAADRKKLTVLSGDVLANQAELEMLQMNLQESEEKLQVIGSSITSLRTDFGGRIAELEEVVKSFNAYRRQTNQELLQLRKELTGAGAR